jgi:UDP-glucose 6-dehydrogenase
MSAKDVYRLLSCAIPVVITDLESAEMIKYAANAFLLPNRQ